MDFPKSVPNIGLVNGRFADENVGTGQPGSLIPAAWGNAVTLEMLNVFSAAGINPDETKTDQLVAALNKLVDLGMTWAKIQNKPTTLGGYGITDAYRVVDVDYRLDGKVNGDWVDVIGFAGDNIANPYLRQKSSGTNILLALAAHGHSFESLSGKPTTLGGYGVTDSYTKVQIGSLLDGKVDRDGTDMVGFAGGFKPNPYMRFGSTGEAVLLSVQGHGHAFSSITERPNTLAGYGITDAYRVIDIDYKLVFKADKASTAAGYGIVDVHTLTSFMKPAADNWVMLSGSAVVPAGGTWAYFVVSYNNVGVIAQSGAGVVQGGATVGYTNSSNGFAWRVQ